MVHAVVGSLTANTGTVTVSPGSATTLTLSGLGGSCYPGNPP